MIRFKGIEGLPFKYILTLMVAALVIAAMFMVLDQFSSTAFAMTRSVDNSLHDVLNNSLSRALK